MLKIIGLIAVVAIVMMVVVVGAAEGLGPQLNIIMAQQTSNQDWKTYYNPEYKFSVDYPNFNGKTNVTDTTNNPSFEFKKTFYSPKYVGFVVAATKSTPQIDPQEALVVALQNKPPHHLLLHGGVFSVIQDEVPGYAYSVLVNGTANMMTTLSFKHNGNTYYFIISGLDRDMQTKGIKKVVDSIKFFD